MNPEFERQIEEIVALPDYSNLCCRVEKEILQIRKKDGDRCRFEQAVWKLKDVLTPVAFLHGFNVYGEGGRMSIGEDYSFALVFVPKDAKATPPAPNVNKKWKR